MNDALRHSLLPFQICQQWDLSVGYERSFKVRASQILANRYLIGISTDSLVSQQARELGTLLGMPRIPTADFWDHYDRADLLLIGFEDSEPGCVYKLYLEFDSLKMASGEGTRLLHRGVKWDVTNPSEYRMSDYHWQPRLSSDEIRDKVDRLLDGLSLRSTMVRLVEEVMGDSQPESIRFLTVQESGRRSFDLNVYSVDLRVRDILDRCREMMSLLDIPKQAIERLELQVGQARLGHLAAGMGSDGEPFFTIYFEPSADESIK